MSIFFDNLSIELGETPKPPPRAIFFPAGEAFFVASVKRYKRRVKRERLAAEVAAFCAQEAIHAREHVRYNEMQDAVS